MRSLQKAARANPALPPSQSIPFINLRSPQNSHRRAPRDAAESLPRRWSRPQPDNSVEFAFRNCSRHARLLVTRVFGNQVGIQSARDPLSRATGLDALPSLAALTRRRRGFALLYQRAIDAGGLKSPGFKTTPIPFSNTPPQLHGAPPQPVASRSLSPHLGVCSLAVPVPLALPAKLKLIHSHGGTA
jgi:hypothetical protein